MNPQLAIQELSVQIDGRSILKGLDLQLDNSEHALLIGRSGSGKSTLLRAIAGLETPQSGKIVIDGRPVSENGRSLVAPSKRGIGYLFQGAALWPTRCVAGQIDFALGSAGVPRGQRKQQIADLLSEVELPGFEKRRVGTLSGGEAQRVALARALAVRPKLLLLDEPLGPLDADLRGALLDRLDFLRREHGIAVLHVTHDPAEAARVADRVLRLTEGRLESEAHPVH